MPYYMYVSLQDDDKIATYTMDSDTGKLTSKSETPVEGGPSSLAISPDRQVLYASHRNSMAISSYRIDHATGGLTQNGKVSVEAAPTFIATDRQGKFLLSSYYQGAHAAVHPLGEDGSVGGAPIEWRQTAIGAHAMQTDPSNQFAFVPHIDNRGGPNAIFQFKFDPDTGHLTPNSPARVDQPPGTGPRHFCFHPNLDILYFSNEQGSSVSGYNLDTATGTLSGFQTISTLPAGYQESNTCSQIQMSPSGKFLYAPNRGHNSIAAFSVDASGKLTPIGQVPTEERPSAFSLDPQGKFVYGAGSETNKLASYRINQDTGELTPMEVYDVGKRPMWVLITNIGG